MFRQQYPPDPPLSRRSGSPIESPRYRQPGHIISVTPPLRLENLLPMEITCSLRIGSLQPLRTSIKPGQVAPLIMVSLLYYWSNLLLIWNKKFTKMIPVMNKLFWQLLIFFHSRAVLKEWNLWFVFIINPHFQRLCPFTNLIMYFKLILARLLRCLIMYFRLILARLLRCL